MNKLGLNKRVQKRFQSEDPIDSVDEIYGESKEFFICLITRLISSPGIDEETKKNLKWQLSQVDGTASWISSYPDIQTKSIDLRKGTDAGISSINDTSSYITLRFNQGESKFIIRVRVSDFPGWNYASFCIAIIDGRICMTVDTVFEFKDDKDIETKFNMSYSSILLIEKLYNMICKNDMRMKDIASGIMETSNKCSHKYSFYDFDDDKVHEYKLKNWYPRIKEDDHVYPDHVDGQLYKKEFDVSEHEWSKEVYRLVRISNVDDVKRIEKDKKQ